MNSNKILEMKSISKKYPGVQALDKVEFSLETGEIHALVGANGAGKSTLVGILSGARKKDSGEIILDNEKVEIDDPLSAIKLGIGFVPQELILCEKLSVAENIYLNRQPKINSIIPVLDMKSMFRKSREVLDLLEVEIDEHAPAGSFSASTQQVIAIAAALSRDAKIIVLDEPTSSLTKKEIKNLFRLMKKLKNVGNTFVFISHRLEEVLEIADRVTVLRDGLSLGTYPVKDVSREKLIKLITGKNVLVEINSRVFNFDKSKKLSTENLCVAGKIENISFSVNLGEIFGFFGQVGSGRTDLLRALFGLEEIESGQILIDGKEYEASSPEKAIKNEIGFLTEDRKNQGLVLNLDIADNFLMGFWESVKHLFIIDNQKIQNISEDYMKSLQIKARDISQEVATLSGGNQQKVVLGKWLIRESKIMLLDEPTKGIDVGAKAEFYKIIRSLADKGVTILLVSSELPEIMALCDRVLVMKDGIISGEFIISETEQNTILEAAL